MMYYIKTKHLKSAISPKWFRAVFTRSPAHRRRIGGLSALEEYVDSDETKRRKIQKIRANEIWKEEVAHLQLLDPAKNRITEGISVTNYTRRALHVKNRLGLITTIDPTRRPRIPNEEREEYIEITFALGGTTKTCKSYIPGNPERELADYTRQGNFFELLREDVGKEFKWYGNPHGLPSYPTEHEATAPMRNRSIYLGGVENRAEKCYGQIYKIKFDEEDIEKLLSNEKIIYDQVTDFMMSFESLDEIVHPTSCEYRHATLVDSVKEGLERTRLSEFVGSIGYWVVGDSHINSQRNIYMVDHWGSVFDVPLMPPGEDTMPPGLYILSDNLHDPNGRWEVLKDSLIEGTRCIRLPLDDALEHGYVHINRDSALAYAKSIANSTSKSNIDGHHQIIKTEIEGAKLKNEDVKLETSRRELETKARTYAANERNELLKIIIPCVTAALGILAGWRAAT